MDNPEVEIAPSQCLTRKTDTLAKVQGLRGQTQSWTVNSAGPQQCLTQDVRCQVGAAHYEKRLCPMITEGVSGQPPWLSHWIHTTWNSTFSPGRESAVSLNPHLNPNPEWGAKAPQEWEADMEKRECTNDWRKGIQRLVSKGLTHFLKLALCSLFVSGSCRWFLNSYFNEMLQFSHITPFF